MLSLSVYFHKKGLSQSVINMSVQDPRMMPINVKCEANVKISFVSGVGFARDVSMQLLSVTDRYRLGQIQNGLFPVCVSSKRSCRKRHRFVCLCKGAIEVCYQCMDKVVPECREGKGRLELQVLLGASENIKIEDWNRIGHDGL